MIMIGIKILVELVIYITVKNALVGKIYLATKAGVHIIDTYLCTCLVVEQLAI